MTCVVGLVTPPGEVWMGGDSAATNSASQQVICADPKVFVRGAYVFGCATSFRMIQLLRYTLRLPPYEETSDLHASFATTFIEERLRVALEAAANHNGDVRTPFVMKHVPATSPSLKAPHNGSAGMQGFSALMSYVRKEWGQPLFSRTPDTGAMSEGSISGRETMNTEDLFLYARMRLLQTPAYRGIPGVVEQMSTLSDLILWLGSMPFPPDHPGEAAAIGELLVILTSFDLDALPQMLVYLRQSASNVVAPGQRSIRAVEEAVAQGDSMQARELAGQILSWQVKRWRPNLRGDMAGWIAYRILET